jgi:DNA-binding SARP family transcriptional activator
MEAALVALRADRLRESAHRALIRVHLAEGNIAEALRSYDACCSTMLRELGLGPSRHTVELMSGARRAGRGAR